MLLSIIIANFEMQLCHLQNETFPGPGMMNFRDSA